MVNQCTKFEVSRFTRYEAAMNGGAKCRKWGGLGALKVMGNVTIRQSAYDFLFDFNRNYVSIFYLFEIQPVVCRKSPILTNSICIWCPRRGEPVEFRGDLWRQKTRVPGLSCGVVRVILRLSVLVKHRFVTDGQTHRRTQGHYRGCVASRGKNQDRPIHTTMTSYHNEIVHSTDTVSFPSANLSTQSNLHTCPPAPALQA